MKNMQLKDENLNVEDSEVEKTFLENDFEFDENGNVLEAVRDRLTTLLRKVSSGSTKRIDKLPSEIGSPGEEVTTQQLGINDITGLNPGETIKIVIAKISDDAGEISIDVTATTADGRTGTKTNIIINDFRDTRSNKLNILKQVLLLINNQETSLTDKQPHEIGEAGKTVTFNQLGIKDLDQNQKNGVVITYEIVKIDDQNGTIDVKVSLSLDGIETPSEKTITVSNFKDLPKKYKEDTEKVIAEFDSIIDTKHKDQLPHWVEKDVVTFEDLGIDQPADLDNTKITYEVKSSSEDSGEVLVTITVEKNGQYTKKDVTVKNFRTRDAQNLIDTQAVAAKFKSPQSTQNRLDIVEWELGDTVTINDLKIIEPETKPGETFEYIVKSNDKVNGVVKIIVNVCKGTKKTPKEIIIYDFKTIAIQDEEDVEDMIESLNSFETTEDFSNIFPTYPRLKKINSGQDLGLKNLKFLESQLVDISYRVFRVDQEEGIVELEATAKKGDTIKTTIIELEGFKKFEDYLPEKTKDLQSKITDQETSLTHRMPNEFANLDDKSFTASDLGIKEFSTEELEVSKIQYFFEQPFANGSMKVKVKVTICRRFDPEEGASIFTDQNLNFSILISGFKSDEQKDQEDANLFIASISPHQPTSKTTYFVEWNKGKNVSNEDLGIPAQTISDNESITYEVISNNQKDGIVVVKMTYKKNKMSSFKMIEIKGFKTRAVKDEEEVKVTAESIEDSTTTLQGVFPTWETNEKVLATDIGLTEITTDAETTISYEILGINQGEGEILVNATVKKGLASCSEEFVVSGFEQPAIFLGKKVERFKKLFGALVTTKSEIKPSKLIEQYPGTVTEDILGIKKLLPEDLGIITLTCVNTKISDSTGEIEAYFKAAMEYRSDDFDTKTTELKPSSQIFTMIISGYKK